MKAFPLFLTVTGKTIVVFGGGQDAAAKIRLVSKTEANLLVVAEALDLNVLQLGTAQWIKTHPLDFVYPTNVAFAYAATGNRALDAALAAKARKAGIIICAVDQPAFSDFLTPAIVDRDPVVVAIGTEGTAPVLSRQIKATVESLLEPSLGLIARAANKLRPWAAHNLTSGYQRREFWTIFLKTMRKQQNSDFTEAKKLAHSIAQDMVDPIKSKNSKGSVDFITTGPGDPELLTLKSRKAINKADTVIYDKSVSQEIIELARREALMLSSEQASEILVHHALNGQHIVRLSASGEFPKQEISSLTQHSIPFMLLPGVEIKQRHKIPTHLFSIPHKTVHLQSSSKAA